MWSSSKQLTDGHACGLAGERPPEDQEEGVDGLVAAGRTDMAPALDLALGLPTRDDLLRQVVFITDGSVGNEHDLLLQIGEDLGESRLFTVSIGSAPKLSRIRELTASSEFVSESMSRASNSARNLA